MLYGMSAWCTHAVRDVPLDASDLVDVVLDQLGVVELHVPVDGPVAEEFMMIVVLVFAGVNHEEMLPPLGILLLPVGLLDGELGDVVVDGLLARGRSLEQPNRIVGGVDIVQRGVGLSAVLYDGFHYIDSSHGAESRVSQCICFCFCFWFKYSVSFVLYLVVNRVEIPPRSMYAIL